jgi:hypothetical protein
LAWTAVWDAIIMSETLFELKAKRKWKSWKGNYFADRLRYKCMNRPTNC